MLRALDLFPHEAPASCVLPIQGRIILRRSQVKLSVGDVRHFIEAGTVKAKDDPDQAQWIAANGF